MSVPGSNSGMYCIISREDATKFVPIFTQPANILSQYLDIPVVEVEILRINTEVELRIPAMVPPLPFVRLAFMYLDLTSNSPR